MASKDPRVQALFVEPDPVLRYITALALATTLTIDNEVDARGVDPFLEMWFRKNIDQLPWTPSMLQPEIQPAGLMPNQQPNPPFVPYDPNSPPAGSVKTLDPDDTANYPAPFPMPPPVPVAPGVTVHSPAPGDVLVGPAKAPGYFDLAPLAYQSSLSDGFTWTQSGRKYLLHITLFGKYWTVLG